MKIETIKNFETKSIGGMESTEASISQEDFGFLFEMMSKSLYSNPKGSICREITSNCFDSHEEAGVDDAVVIKKGYDEEGDFISFNDFGVGLSPKRMLKIYMNYFSSTKRHTNKQIGGFGLGSKTPLSYVDNFYITTNYNGIKYLYSFSKGEVKPTLDFLSGSEEREVGFIEHKTIDGIKLPVIKPKTIKWPLGYETTDRNGTEIRIYIDSEKDIHEFREELKSQLCYFDNVYFDKWNIDNDYKIHDLEYFKYRNKDQYNEEMHIILGKVCYPISWKEIDTKSIPIPIGVKFEIGELVVTPNRESLRYTNEVKKLVKERVDLAFKELIELFESQNKTIDNYFEWYELKNSKPFITFEGGDKLYLNNISQVSKKHKCSIFDGIDYFNRENLLEKLYTSVKRFSGRVILKDTHSRLRPDSNRIFIGDISNITEAFAYTFEHGEVFRPTKLDHKDLKYSVTDNRTFVNVSDPKDWEKVSSLTRENGILDISEADRGISKFGNKYTYFNLGIGLRIYKAIKTIRSQCEQKWNIYRELTNEEKAIFKAWKDENNAALQRKLAGKVLVKDMNTVHNSYEWKVADEIISKGKKDSNGKFIKGKVNHGINSYKGIVIYGFRDDTKRLKKAVTLLCQLSTLVNAEYRLIKLNEESCRVIQISQQNERYFKGKNNMIHVGNFYSDNKLFRKLASSLKIEKYFADIGRFQSGGSNIFINEINELCTPIGDKLKKLMSYYDNTSKKEDIRGSDITRGDVRNEVLDIANKLNLFDPNVELIFKELDEWFKGVEIIKFTEINDESRPYIIKLLGDNKKKLNLEYYQDYVEIYGINNVEPKLLGSGWIGINRYKVIQEVLKFDDIKEETNITKLKFITNKAV